MRKKKLKTLAFKNGKTIDLRNNITSSSPPQMFLDARFDLYTNDRPGRNVKKKKCIIVIIKKKKT